MTRGGERIFATGCGGAVTTELAIGLGILVAVWLLVRWLFRRAEVRHRRGNMAPKGFERMDDD